MQRPSEIKTIENSSLKLPSSQKKFLNHFHSINTPHNAQPNFTSTLVSNKKNFVNTLESYATNPSIIDKIADSPIKQSRVNSIQRQQLDFVTDPLVLNLNPGIGERITNINRFFMTDQFDHYTDEQPVNLLTYIQAIQKIPILNNRNSRSRSRSREQNKTERKGDYLKSTPPKYVVMSPMQEAEVNTEPVQGNDKSGRKLKKIDLLLMEIMQEKKRRSNVKDYFGTIQMKLTQLFEYILHDQFDYFGLSVSEKMRLVLKNLQKFKGKMIDGESKCSMLRIFFEEFRNLKKQKEDEQNYYTTLISDQDQKIKKSQYANSKINSKQNKSQSNKEKSNKEKISVKNFLAVPSPNKSSKVPKKSFETMSVGGKNNHSNIENKSKKGPKSSMFEQQDAWIGSLG